MSRLGLILARRGSTRLPDKVMLPVGGKPMVQRAIEAAKESGVFDEIAVSTDWQDVTNQAKLAGATVIGRPLALAGECGLAEVVHHALGTLGRLGKNFDVLGVLGASVPFLEPRDIRLAVELYEKEKPQSVVSLTETRPIQFVHHKSGKRDLWKEARPDRDEVSPRYEFTGAFTVVGVPYFMETRRLIGMKCWAILSKPPCSLSVNTPWDYMAACAWAAEIEKMKGETVNV